MNFRERLQRFFIGRYGGDGLNTALNVCALVSFFAAWIFSAAVRSTAGAIVGWVLYAIAAALLGFGIFRMLSRNLSARRAEYEWYRSHIAAPLAKRRSTARTKRAQSATHRFFRCPKCGQTVRVPRGKGRIRITCPKCGHSFEKKS
ncbi:MAG: hypothetical protein IKG85_00420 [Clostridia bacterium]|nr:hypothetical protein [Clostridia bacterium]